MSSARQSFIPAAAELKLFGLFHRSEFYRQALQTISLEQWQQLGISGAQAQLYAVLPHYLSSLCLISSSLFSMADTLQVCGFSLL